MSLYLRLSSPMRFEKMRNASKYEIRAYLYMGSVFDLCLCVCVCVSLHSYLTYIKLWTVVKRNESMAHMLQAKLKEPQTDENKRGPRPQDLIRLYDIILQVRTHTWVVFSSHKTEGNRVKQGGTT
jgi:hypothetical protein